VAHEWYYLDCVDRFAPQQCAHLPNTTVTLLTDGVTSTVTTNGAGAFTPPVGYTTLIVGFDNGCSLETMRLNAGAQDGTSQGKQSRINKAAVRFLRTFGMTIGQKSTDMKVFPEIDDAAISNPVLYTGDLLTEFPGDYTFDSRIRLESQGPYPCTIVAIFPQVTVYDR
jgi:hypothetical protein